MGDVRYTQHHFSSTTNQKRLTLSGVYFWQLRKQEIVPANCLPLYIHSYHLNTFTVASMISLSYIYTDLLSLRTILPLAICTIFFLVTINRFLSMPKRRATTYALPRRNVKPKVAEFEDKAQSE